MNRLVAYYDYRHGGFWVLITGVDKKQEVIDYLRHTWRVNSLAQINWEILTEEEAKQQGLNLSCVTKEYSFEEFKKWQDKPAARAARGALYGKDKDKLLELVLGCGWTTTMLLLLLFILFMVVFMLFVAPLLLMAQGLRRLAQLLRKHLGVR